MPKTKIVKKSGFHFNNTDSEIIVEEFGRIINRDGSLSKHTLINEAKPKKSRLHSMFEWNDKVCGIKYRLEQAEYMIRAFEVIVEDKDNGETRKVRYLSPVVMNEEQVFVPTLKALRSKDLRSQVLDRAWSELSSFMEKYRNLVEFEPIFKIIRITMKKHKVS